MKRKWNGRKLFHRCALILLLLAVFHLTFQKEETQNSDGEKSGSWKTYLVESIGSRMLATWLPAFSYVQPEENGNSLFQLILRQQLPVLAYGSESGNNVSRGEQGGDGAGKAGESETEAVGETWWSEDALEAERESDSPDSRLELDGEMARLLAEENSHQSGQTGSDETVREKWDPGRTESGFRTEGFEKAAEPQQEYNWSYYQDFDALVKEFYSVDATTEVDSDRLDLDSLRGKDMTIEKDPEVPQILIYHTHSQEAFTDSVDGDEGTTIMGAGELLAEILREEYGYNVIHYTGKFDVESRDYAYSNALPAIERVLEEFPSIEVVIDLHRDEMLGGRKLVTELNGEPTARLMFFNGLSHTREQGDIEYLENPYIDDNLAFSFQMQAAANEYYPGLTRKIYLKGYRYNMHLCPKSLLIELGAQTNTVEEIQNACFPIAHILDLVLSG